MTRIRAGAALALLLYPGVAGAKGQPTDRQKAGARKDAVVDELFGTRVPDPYRWLEEGDAPEVKRWTDEQNARTRRHLDRAPGRRALERRFWQLYEIGSLGVPYSRPLPGGGRRYFHTRRDGKQNQPVLYVRDGLDGKERVLVDVNAERADGTRALDWWFPSEDGALVAYGASDDGSEESVLRIRDAATGADLPDRIPRARHGSLAWTPTGDGFYYTRYPARGEVPEGEEHYHRSVFFHRLGDDPAGDRKLFGEGREKTDWPGVDLSPSGRWLAITVSQGWSKSEVYLLDTRRPDAPPVPVAVNEEAQFRVIEVLDDRLYLFTTSGAPRGRLYAVDPARPERARWRLVLPEGEDVLEQVSYFQGGLAAGYLHDAAVRLRLFSPEGSPRGEVPLPDLGALTGLSSARDTAEMFYGFTSFLTPTAVYRLPPPAPGATPTARLWRKLEAPIDPDRYETERVMVTSRDGSRAPLFLLRRKDTPRQGQRPTVLTGYGGFDVDMLPVWTPSAIPFIDAGGVYALAVLRGGGEYGEAWHQAGMLDRKQNVFDDFIAAATWLIENGVTRADRLGIKGGSNGGLLMGAALTQRPDLFQAVVCGVPLLDMVRYHRFRIAALWIPEYGSPDDPKAFRWLLAYSPYHKVEDGVAYPAVLFHTAVSDTRVDPMHARKMTARLQEATGSKRPVLLRLESKAGHGAGKPLAKVIAQVVDEWTFLMSQLKVRIGRTNG